MPATTRNESEELQASARNLLDLARLAQSWPGREAQSVLDQFTDFLSERLCMRGILVRLDAPGPTATLERIHVASDAPPVETVAALTESLASHPQAQPKEGFGLHVLVRPVSSGTARAGWVAAAFTQPCLTVAAGAHLFEAAVHQLAGWYRSACLLEEKTRESNDRGEALLREEAGRLRAESINKSRDAFLSAIAHELRTPLSPILLWTSMLKSRELNEEKQQKAIETIERCTRSQALLIDNLLDISRIAAGKLRVESHPMRLLPVLQAAVESVRPAALANEVRLHVDLGTDIAPSVGDSKRLQQVTEDLLAHAVKATRKGGEVTIRLHRTDGHVELVVHHDGAGIPTGLTTDLFDRFRETDGGPARIHGGLGLELTIARHVIAAHGGSIQAESLATAQGVTLTVRLPLGGPLPSARALLPSRSPGWRHDLLRDLRILVIDDESETREAIRQLLAASGAEVETAESAEQARGVLEHWQPDLLITDIGMPGEDGYTFVRRLRSEDRGTPRIPAIALTAHGTAEDRRRAVSAGFHAHVLKPADPKELIELAADISRRQRVN